MTEEIAKCSVCSSPVMYGSRHSQCGAALIRIEREAIATARRHAKLKPQSYYAEPFYPHEWVINALKEVIQERDNLSAINAEMTAALEHILEYWNKDRNESAMHDALWHTIETAGDALAKAKGGGRDSQPAKIFHTDNPITPQQETRSMFREGMTELRFPKEIEDKIESAGKKK